MDIRPRALRKIPDTPKRGSGILVPLTGVEPVRLFRAWDFKSLVSAYSTTAAFAHILALISVPVKYFCANNYVWEF